MLEVSRGAVNKELRQLLTRFADNESQHLMTENAIVLPIARSKLTESDLKILGESMAARRGVDMKTVSRC